MKQRRIGDRLVGEIGLGCMGMSWAYGSGASESDAAAVLHRALELGVNHWDTADLYGSGENEKLIAPVVRERRSEVFLATKFGNVYNRSLTSHQDLVAANAPWIVDGTPGYVRRSIDLSLQRLGIDQIDLYYLHRVDPKVQIEETVGAMAELVKSGKVKYLGLSEVSSSTLKRAHAVHPITAVQNEFSLWTRDFEEDELPVTKELGIAFVPYSPLGRGFLTGEIKSLDDLAPDDWRRNNPRFQGDNFKKNLELVDVVKDIASKYKATPAQVALAWVLAQGDNILPIPGTKRVKRLEENVGASALELDAVDLATLSDIGDAEGSRYPEVAMAFAKA
jgi:aryl-alcohol dehydrogenase-like predicted oxidoreductase